MSSCNVLSDRALGNRLHGRLSAARKLQTLSLSIRSRTPLVLRIQRISNFSLTGEAAI